MRRPTPITYRQAGVDLETADEALRRIAVHARRTRTPGVLADVGAFAGLFQLNAAGRRAYRDPLLVACTDGVGTKLKLAALCGRHRGIGVDLVAMSVNDLLTSGAEPLFFLDYFASGRLAPDLCEEVVAGIADGCLQAGCALLGGETAEMPGCYPPGEYDLAGFAVGVLERGEALDGRGVLPGDALIGLPSSGLHANGYSLARRLLLEEAGYGPETVVPGTGRSVADLLLEPTRIYAGVVRGLLERFGRHDPLRAIAHITGGGLPGNVPRVLPAGLGLRLERDAWTPPPLFEALAQAGAVDEDEMFRVFNMGIGLVLVVAEAAAEAVLRHLGAAGEDARPIGRVIE